MKYSIVINQKKVCEWGLSTSEAFVFSWLYELPSWAEKLEYKGKTFYFASRNKALEELPSISKKTDTIYRIYRSLQNKGLINILFIDKHDFVYLTEEGKKWYDGEASEKNPTDGNKLKETEIFPTYDNTSERKEIKKEDTTVSKKVIDYDLILTKWEEICPMLITPRSIDEKRKAKIRTLLKNHNADIEELFKCFEIISKSVFLTNADGDNKNNWKATFDWLINDTKSCYNGIFEGKYNFKNKPNVENLDENNTGEIIINGIKYQS